MMSPLVRSLAAALVMSVAPACSVDNPVFGLTGRGETTTTGSEATTSSTTTTGEPVTTTVQPGTSLDSGGEGSTYPTTADSDPGSAEATSLVTDPIGTTTDASTTDPNPGTGTSSTGEPLPDTSTGEPPLEPVDVLASFASCVLLPANGFPYAGPLTCETIVEVNDAVAETGVMILDKGYVLSGNREGRIYMYFKIPVAPPEKDLISATLIVQASTDGDAGAAWSGALYITQPFTEISLNAFTPGASNLTGNPGPSVPGQPSSWQIPPEVITANNPLYLGLIALDTDGVLYRSTRADAANKPKLRLIYG